MYRRQIFADSFFEDISYKEIDSFLSFYHKALVGSPIFSNRASLISALIQKLTRKSNKEVFVPSHVGIIFEYKDTLYVLNIKFPKTQVIPLKDYLIGEGDSFKDNYKVFLRDFCIDKDVFNTEAAKLIGKRYPIGSAILSLLNDKVDTPRKLHCSEAYARLCHIAGGCPFLPFECTPNELYNAMKGE